MLCQFHPGAYAARLAFLTTALLCSRTVFAADDAADVATRPNIVLVMTDDQGYGDLACLGNTQIKTPHLNRLHAESVRLTNYHVDPTCSPTRAALMTGRYSTRTGVWHTIQGRSIMHTDETTVAEVFAAAGYRTGVFGKWHLGDNFPCRPQDQGFHETLIHGGGGVTQTPDYWGNDYFDDTYWHNGETKKYTGYCTNVFFDGALDFIEKNKSKPFLCYIPTNAAHGPFLVAEKYSKPYKDMGIESPRAEFYGMITNIDENMARLDKTLSELGLRENTILIFTTDNGTAAGAGRRGQGYNAGMRGQKGSEYEGGHRVPFFLRWPKGGLGGERRAEGGERRAGRDVDVLTAHIDVLPTLADLCNVKFPAKLDIDGTSLKPLLASSRTPRTQNPEPPSPRTLFVHSQRIEHPEKWRKSAVMTARWRLINGKELYDVVADPGQKQNVAAEHEDVVEKLRGEYETWWKHIDGRFGDYVRITIGSDKENPAHLTCHDWHEPTNGVPWNQGHIKKDLKSNGFWAIDVAEAGKYEFTLRTRPSPFKHSLEAESVNVRVARKDRRDAVDTRRTSPDATSVTLELELKQGPARLETLLQSEDEKQRGAYFVEVRRVE